jgi:Tol biopolymer transport system component
MALFGVLCAAVSPSRLVAQSGCPRRIAFGLNDAESMNGSIRIVESDRPDPNAGGPVAKGPFVIPLAWSPDGDRLLFLGVLDGEEEILREYEELTFHTLLYTVGFDGSGLVRVVDVPVTLPAWSPDGSRVAFISSFEASKSSLDESGPPPSALYVVESFGGIPRRLTAIEGNHGAPLWSPSGDRIAVAIDIRESGPPRPDLFVVELASGRSVELVDSPTPDRQPAWSPDGSRLAFSRERMSLQAGPTLHDLYLVDADGGVPGPLTREDGAWKAVGWSPDGAIVYAMADRLIAIEVETGERRDLTDELGLPPLNAPRLDPDGRRLVFWTREDPHDSAQERWLESLDLASGSRHRIARIPAETSYDVAWTACLSQPGR